MASDESELLYLRPEAQPIEHWDRLTEYQKKGLEHLLNMLREAVGKNAGDDSQRPQKRLPWLFAETKTRLAFINGFRGTGKTTLMTTLVGAIDEPDAFKEGQPGDDIDQGRFKTVKQLATDLHNQVIPVQPLDMEALPPNTPLLAAILARVYRAAQDYTQDFDAPRGLLADDPADNREARRLKIFQQRVAKALDSNLRVRMGNLDPDQFAEAVMAEEDNRLGMVRDLEQVLSDLSKTLRETLKRSSRVKSGDGQLLFIVPIDDVDLNPHRCLELLRLLRTFSPPRELFFLLMGQYDLVESIFKLQIAADFGKVHKEGDGLLTLSKKTLQNDLAAVSAANVRKMIPPHARVDLPKLSLADVLEFRPLGLRNSTDARTQGDSQAGKSAPLEELFRRIPLWTKEGKTCRFPTLAALVSGSREESADFAALRNVASACDFNWAQYCGLGMYQVHARRLADVWIELRHMLEMLPPRNGTGDTGATPQAARSIQELLSKHWARAVDADPHLSADERRRLEREGLGRCTRFPDDEPAYERDLEIADAAIEVKFDNDNYPATTYHPRLRFTALWAGSGVPQFDLRVAARPHATDEVSSSTPGAIPVESEATRCSGVLRHDLFELFNAETQTIGEFPELTSERPVRLSWVGSEGEVAAYPWPIPPLPTFVETSRFLNDWWAIQNSVLNSTASSEVAHTDPDLSSGVSSGKGTKNTTSTTNSRDEAATIPAERVERLALQWAVLGLAAVEESLTRSLPGAEATSPLRQPNVNWKELAERFFVLRNSAKAANHLRGWGQLDK
ncbi:MAG: hypothetical protein NT069_24710, partial [Planctomycetota bacterium]|nr:hypothetical protein [Planctomycetota bacterium]